MLKNILGVKYDVNNIPLMSTNGMYKQFEFRDIHKYFLLNFFIFIYHVRVDIFIKHFETLLPHNNYVTRNSRINLPYIRTDTEKHSTISGL